MKTKQHLSKIGSIGGSKKTPAKKISSSNNLLIANKKIAIKKEIGLLKKSLINLSTTERKKPFPEWYNNRFEYKKKYSSLRCRIYRLTKKLNGGSHTKEEWQILIKIVDGKCPSCGEKKVLTKDHIIPICWGGKNNIQNIQPLCRTCNAKKCADHDRNFLLDKIDIIKKEMSKILQEDKK